MTVFCVSFANVDDSCGGDGDDDDDNGGQPQLER